jgi:HPt (histidine-containing phosphotransfer) domain-containing protein
LTQGLERQDQRAVERAVHTLKSAAQSVGARALSELARVAEGHARAGALEAVQASVADIHRQFDDVAAQLESLRSELLQPPQELVES